jgi:hypothetical protein
MFHLYNRLTVELVAAEVASGVCGLHDHGFAGDGGGGEG